MWRDPPQAAGPAAAHQRWGRWLEREWVVTGRSAQAASAPAQAQAFREQRAGWGWDRTGRVLDRL